MTPDKQGKIYYDESGDSYKAWALYNRALTQDEIDYIKSNCNYYGGIGRPFSEFSYCYQTKRRTLIVCFCGWDV